MQEVIPLEDIRGYSDHMWKMLVIMGVIFFIINLALGAISFVSIGILAIGAFVFAITKYDDIKLQKLKQNGQAITPDKVTFVPVYSWSTGGSAMREVYRGFRVECQFHDLGTNLRVEMSRMFAIHRGWMSIAIHSSPLTCRATVYINPNNPKDFAIDVEVI
jgi:hypothetical protein